MMRQRNPLDPLDDYKRWYQDLWPMQRVGFWAGVAVVMWILFKWVTH